MDIREKQPTTKKEKFYLFTGIDETLIGKDFVKRFYRSVPFVYGGYIPDPDCVKALNYLIKGLEQKYDVRLVITSKRRRNEVSCENYLKLYGLDYHKPMYFTKFISGDRGEKIVDFLEEQGASPLTFHTAPLYVRFLKNFKDNPDFKNYLVIEGGNKNISKYIPKSQFLKVGRQKGLTRDDATFALLDLGLESPSMYN